MYIMYANGGVSVDSSCNFSNKYFWNWSDNAADIILTKIQLNVWIPGLFWKTSLRCILT